MSMRSRPASPSAWRLYVVLDGPSCRRDPVETARLAIQGGCDVVQLRHKQALAKELLAIGRPLRQLARRHRVAFIVNDRVDVALALDADGVHLGQDDLPIRVARQMMGREKLVGLSTHSLSQAVVAERAGADYLGVGPVFATPTKPEYQAVGLKLVRQVSRRVRIPFVAIGGIDETNVQEVVAAGARAVAVVRAVVAAQRPDHAARALRELMR